MISRVGSALRVFGQTWVSLTRPTPFGEKISSSSLVKRILNPWQGYHVTQMNRVKGQLEKGAFENHDRHLFFSPFISGKRSPLIFGGNTFGCWSADDPVILRIGSSNLWRWDGVYDYPFFSRGPKQDVKILDAWKCNEKWLEQMRQHEVLPKTPEKLRISSEAALAELIKIEFELDNIPHLIG